jgi:hypothetical protein
MTAHLTSIDRIVYGRLSANDAVEQQKYQEMSEHAMILYFSIEGSMPRDGRLQQT